MQNHSLINLLKIAVTPSLIVYICILVFTSAAGIETGLVLRDLLQTCDYPIGVGMLSNLGILLWAAASAITLFSSISLLVQNRPYRKLLIIGGLLSLLLCLDDLFLLHDKQQINQDILYTAYIILGLFLLLKFSKLIKEIDIIAFFASTSLLALSIISDIFQDFFPISYQTVQIIEEGFKFVGIACWLYFWSKASIKTIRYEK